MGAWPGIFYFSRTAASYSVRLLAAAHLVSEWVACPVPCQGESMLPTLNHMGDAVLVSPLPYWRPSWLAGGGRRPARGELVVYRKPTDPTCFVLKRVVAVEGDVVEVDPRRDSPPWDYWGAATKDGSDNPGADKWGQGKYIRVPKGHVWTAGDNLTNSTDSRDYGPVPVACIKGMVVARVFRDTKPCWEWFGSNVRVLGESPYPFPAT